MENSDLRVERAQNLWASFERKFEPVAQATQLDPNPQLELSEIGGLAHAKEEILSIHLRRRGRDPLQYPIDELAAQAARLTGAELEQAITAALYAAFSESRELSESDLENAIHDTVPLYDTYEERIKELRDWGRGRTRPASVDAKMVDLFSES